MAYRSALVSQAEIKRTVAAVIENGVLPGRIEVDHRTGKVTIYPQSAERRDADKTGWEDLE